jgi:hypothetical protein
VTSFNGDFYLAAATAIPVLWLTAGFASSAIANILRWLRGMDLTPLLDQPGMRSIVGTRRARPLGDGSERPGAAARLVRVIDSRVTQPGLTLLFVLVLVGAGIVGELLSFVALYRRDVPSWVGLAVLVSICVLAGLCGLTLLVSMALAGHQASTERQDLERALDAAAPGGPTPGPPVDERGSGAG